MTLFQTLLAPGGGGYDDGCSNYEQTPNMTDDFAAGKIAMMLNGPWNFGIFTGINPDEVYGKYFGIAPTPTESAGQKAHAPLGGEDWQISKSGSKAEQQLAFDYVKGTQTPSEELNLANQFGYLPARISVAKEFVKAAGPHGTPTRRRSCMRIRARSVSARSTTRSRRQSGTRSRLFRRLRPPVK